MADILNLYERVGRGRWVVTDPTGVPYEPVTRFLDYLAASEKSSNTLRAYASDLRNYFSYLESRNLTWTSVTTEDLAYFLAYLRKPFVATTGKDKGLTKQKSESACNRNMAVAASFYRFMSQATNDRTYDRLSVGLGKRYRPRVSLLDGVAHTTQQTEKAVGPRLKTQRPPQHTLSKEQIAKILSACRNRRDRLLFMLLFSSGLRISQALSLRHSDLSVPDRTVSIFRRDQQTEVHNNKSETPAVIPIPEEVVRLYLDYMFGEYKDLDSDYIFVNLWNGTVGRPMTYSNVMSIVAELQKSSGIDGWSPHTFRHTYVSVCSRAGVPISIISRLVTHKNVQTTIDTYEHMGTEDLRSILERHNVWEKLI